MRRRSRNWRRSLPVRSRILLRSPTRPISPRCWRASARDAKESLPGDLRAVAPLLDDYRQALGLSFDIDDAKGDRFFHSSLIQAAFYSLSPPGCSGTEVTTRRLLIWRRRRTICEIRSFLRSRATRFGLSCEAQGGC